MQEEKQCVSFPCACTPMRSLLKCPQVNNACSTFHRVCYPWGVKYKRVALKCNKMQRVQLVGDDEVSVLDHLTN